MDIFHTNEIYPLTVSHIRYVSDAELIDFQLQHWHGSDWDGSNLEYTGHRKRMFREVWQPFRSDLSSEIGRNLWKIFSIDSSRSMVQSDIPWWNNTIPFEHVPKYIFQELRYCTSYATKYCSTWSTSNVTYICWVAKLKHLQINRTQANYKIFQLDKGLLWIAKPLQTTQIFRQNTLQLTNIIHDTSAPFVNSGAVYFFRILGRQYQPEDVPPQQSRHTFPWNIFKVVLLFAETFSINWFKLILERILFVTHLVLLFVTAFVKGIEHLSNCSMFSMKFLIG